MNKSSETPELQKILRITQEDLESARREEAEMAAESKQWVEEWLKNHPEAAKKFESRFSKTKKTESP